MGALQNSGIEGRVEWLGIVPDRTATLKSSPFRTVDVGFAGFPGESHGGVNRLSCARVEDLYEVDTEIRNTRQISIVSTEELAEIAKDMGLAELSPGYVGANVVISGIPCFTLVPPSSRLQFSGGATLVVDMENLPCHLPAREIEKDFPGYGKKFKRSASSRRGVTAWVERTGKIEIGGSVAMFVPAQSAWPAARTRLA